MSTHYKDNEYYVRSGDIESAIWRIEGNYFSRYGGESIPLSKFSIAVMIKDEHYVKQTAMGRVAGGILGGVLLGGIGAAAGLLAGGRSKIDDTEVMCTLDDGRTFSAKCSQTGAARIVSLAQLNSSRKNEVNSKITPSIAIDTHKVESNKDRYECPSCAELIKVNAKVCRYCGYIPTEDDRRSFNEKLESKIENTSTGDIAKFISDYRREVKKTPFITDADLIKTLSLLIENSHSDTPIYTYRKKLSVKYKMDSSREYRVSERHLEQLCFGVKTIESFRESYGNNLNEEQFNDVLNIVLKLGRDDLKLETSQRREFFNIELRKCWGDLPVVADVSRKLAFFRWLEYRSYLISNALVFVNSEDRSSSIRLLKNEKATHDTPHINKYAKEIFASDKFKEFYITHFDDDNSPPKDLEVAALFTTINEMHTYCTSEFDVNELLVNAYESCGWTEEAEKEPRMKFDEWLLLNLKDVLLSYMSYQENISNIDPNNFVSKFVSIYAEEVRKVTNGSPLSS